MLSDVGLTLDPLLAIQREAVTCEREPLLILGGAGTGKSRDHVGLSRSHPGEKQKTK